MDKGVFWFFFFCFNPRHYGPQGHFGLKLIDFFFIFEPVRTITYVSVLTVLVKETLLVSEIRRRVGHVFACKNWYFVIMTFKS